MAGHYWYVELDSKVIRKFVDHAFPGLATDPIADSLDGRWHRWKEGHDLLTDVLPRITTDPGGAFHQAGHILLTDFPTVDGIPIPGLSANGIGLHILDLLKDHGINAGHLCINIDEALQGGIGIMAVAESHTDLIQAMNGGTLDGWTSFDTFGEGAIELVAGLNLPQLILTTNTGIAVHNPLLVAAAIENVVSGVVRTFNSIQLAIDDMVTSVEEFFGAVLGGSLIGIGISLFISRKQATAQRIQKALITGGRAAILGGAGVISPFLSMGLAAGFCFHELCKSIISGEAKVHEYKPGIFHVSLAACMVSSSFREAWEAYATQQQKVEQHLKKHLAGIRRILEEQDSAIMQSCTMPSSFIKDNDVYDIQQQVIKQRVEKQVARIHSELEEQESATKQSLKQAESNLAVNFIPPHLANTPDESIASMLNEQQNNINKLL